MSDMNTARVSVTPRSAARVDVVVIGGGVGGLAVAARAAAAGKRVVLCEQADVVGGKLGLFERDGFRFDTGPSLVTLPYLLDDLLRTTGVEPREHIELRRLDPIARYRFCDGTWFDAPSDALAFEDAVEALRPGNAKQWRAFYEHAGRIWDATRVPFLESPLRGPWDLVKQSVRVRDLVTIAPWRTLRSMAEHYLDDERLVTFVDRYATYTGSDPRRAPAALASVPYAERHFGAWYVNGGLRQIADVLLERCVALGVDIRTRADVVEVVVRNGRASGVVLADGSRIDASAVVANADAAHLYDDLVAPSAAQRKAKRALAKSEPSLSGFVLCLGVKGRTPVTAHHTVLFPERYDDEFDSVFGDKHHGPRPVADPTIYISNPADSAVRPDGHESWFILVNAPRHTAQGDTQEGVDWSVPGRADGYADLVLQRLAERFFDVRPHVVFSELRTPADLATRTRASGGSIYGTSSNGSRSAFLRPSNQSPVPGLFLVGGSSHPGGGLPLVMLSAQIVAGLL
jgi:phytoene desaturase